MKRSNIKVYGTKCYICKNAMRKYHKAVRRANKVRISEIAEA